VSNDFPPKSVTVVIVEDDLEILERLHNVMAEHPSFRVLAAVTNVENGLAALQDYRPQVLLTDLGLPDGSGLSLIRSVCDQNMPCESLVISGFQDEHLVFKALEAGAKGYILKHDNSQTITDAVVTMLNGGAPISPMIARLMLSRFQQAPDASQLPEALTERQINILKLVSQGFSSREISEKLDISYYTVTTHIKNIYNKLQVNSRTEALHEAVKLGLL